MRTKRLAENTCMVVETCTEIVTVVEATWNISSKAKFRKVEFLLSTPYGC